MTLEPTPNLRWLEIPWGMPSSSAIVPHEGAKPRVLQQWWRDVRTGEGEWRDVPLEAE